MKTLSFKTLVAALLVLMVSCNLNNKTVVPEKLGLSSDTLLQTIQKMNDFVENGKVAGISLMVLKNGKVAMRANTGFADTENQKPIEDNSIYRIYSMTKPITAAALMTLYDEGKFNLDDKLSKYIPEFDGAMVYTPGEAGPTLEPQVEELTVRHLLTHTSGIPYGWDPNAYVDSLYRAVGVSGWNGTIGEKVKQLATLPLKSQPGTKWEYGLSIDVAGYLVEVLSGMPLDTFFKTRIFEPLKMDDSGFFVPEGKHERLAEVYNTGRDGSIKKSVNPNGDNFKKPATLFSGGGGLVSTMDDYARFCSMLLNGGELDGVRILKEQTVDLILTNQLPAPAPYRNGYGYGLAGEVNLETGVYSWSGAASTNFWIDRENNMIILVFAQLMPSNSKYATELKEIVNRALIK